MKYVYVLVDSGRQILVFKNKLDAKLYMYELYGKENIKFEKKINDMEMYIWLGNLEDIYIHKCKIL